MSTQSKVKKTKILYLMHVDWHWIKQRPHFLAEELSSEFEVLVVYPRVNNRSHLVENETDLRKIPMMQLPLIRPRRVTGFLNEWIRGCYFFMLMYRYKPQVVWIPFPNVIPTVFLQKCGSAKIVYDCMDDAPAFVPVESRKSLMLSKEQVLLKTADVVFASSLNLLEKMLERGACADKVRLVRNAYNGVEFVPSVRELSNRVFRILYIGTVLEYIDFEVILHCLREIKSIEFHFIGPILTDCPTHERIKYHGPVEHARLVELMQPYDCFIMPFKIDELIQGVDPVKLYEYINFNKNILCPYYKEIERFSDFVFYYRNKDELARLIHNLLSNNELRYDEGQRQSFLKNNNWKIRIVEITKFLNEKLLSRSDRSRNQNLP